MSWVNRDKSTNWSHFQYDSADLPFSGEGAYLESGTPLWKINTITEVEKSFCTGPSDTTKDQYLAPLVKLLNSRSSENLAGFGVDRSPAPAVPTAPPPTVNISAEDRRRMSQSLPATPLSTPYTTPAPTPYATPLPTPQSSPQPQRKADMDAVCKAALRCQQRLASEPPAAAQNIKWYYGFLPHGNEQCRAGDVAANNLPSKQLVAKRADVKPTTAARTQDANAVPASAPTAVLGPCRRRCAPLVSNRDMNFLAPTSM